MDINNKSKVLNTFSVSFDSIFCGKTIFISKKILKEFFLKVLKAKSVSAFLSVPNKNNAICFVCYNMVG